MNYRSVDDLNSQVVLWMGQLPRDLDLIVGIPRSGLFAGSLLALHLNLPITDVDGLLEGRVSRAGATRTVRVGSRIRAESEELFSDDSWQADDFDRGEFLDQPRNVLVVDDSIDTGSQMREVQSVLQSAGLAHQTSFAAVYASRHGTELVDYYCEVVAGPRVFEWNMFHDDWLLDRTCVDIDGVLCRDPTDEENDDGANYLEFIRSVEPYYLPTVPVRCLVTSRLEKYRPQTEEWLFRNGVEYRELIMMDFPDMATRRAAQAYGSFKASALERTQALLFIESSIWQAREIANLTGKPVFCMDSRSMIGADLGPKIRHSVAKAPGFGMRKVRGAGRRAKKLLTNAGA